MATTLTNDQLASAIIAQNAAIIGAWLNRVKCEIPAAQGQSDEYLIDHTPRLLRSLAATFGEPQKTEHLKGIIENSKAHAVQRTRSRYSSADLIAEYIMLREVCISEISGRGLLSEENATTLMRVFASALGTALEEFGSVKKPDAVAATAAEMASYISQPRVESHPEPLGKTATAILSAERSLAEAKEDLKLVADAVLTLIIRVDLEFRYVFVNNAYETWSGRPSSAVIGHSINEFVKPEMAQVTSEYLARAMAGEKVSFEHEMASHDGTRKHFLLSFAPARESSGAIVGAVITGQDIEQQKQAELDAQERRNELVNVFSQAPYPIALMMGPDHVFTLANPPYVDYVGRNPLGRKVRTVFTEDEAGPFFKLLDDVYRTGEPYIGQELPLQLAKKTGGFDQHFVNVSYYPYRSQESEIIGILAFVTDVTAQVQARDALQETESRMRSVFAHASVGFAVSDLEGHFLDVNPRFCEITGYTAEELKTLSILDIVHMADLQMDRTKTDELVSGKIDSFVIEKRFVKKNGSTAWVRNSVSLLPTGSGAMQMIRVAEDVTVVCQAEAQRRESEERFTFLADSMPQIVWTATAEGVVDYFNELWFTYTGTTSTNFGTTWDSVIHPDDREPAIARWQRSLAMSLPYEMEVRLRGADGAYRWFITRAKATKDRHGKIKKWYGTNTDIHDFKSLNQILAATKDNLESERQKFRTLVADANTAMAVLAGPELVFEIVNQSYAKLFDDRELVGRPLLKALPELEGQKFPELLKEAFENGKVYREIEALARLRRTADGVLEDRYFDQSYTPITDGEKRTTGVFIQAVDVTSRVRAEIELRDAKERAELASAAKSSFLANMSHEIRTPLGAIMGFVSLIKDETTTPQALTEYVSVIERNSAQLMRIIDDILDLSKVEAGMMLIEDIDFSLVELLSDFASLMGFRAREKGIQFELKALTELPDIITSDPTRIRQILTNVVGNAIKFTDRGSVFLQVDFKNDELTFDVQDTGRGIANDQVSRLFQPFSQGDASTTRKYGGTGLGLVLTRRLAEALGGKFELTQSQQNVGSRFIATVKIKRPGSSRFVRALGFDSEPIRNAGPQNLLNGLRILLVEDSPDNQALFSIYLNRAGAKIDIAADGKRGVEMALGDSYDVVLMDVQMPIMDGITAVKLLRAKGYDQPIIALTAHAMKEERQRCLEAGYTAFLSKPVQRAELVNTLLKFQN